MPAMLRTCLVILIANGALAFALRCIQGGKENLSKLDLTSKLHLLVETSVYENSEVVKTIPIRYFYDSSTNVTAIYHGKEDEQIFIVNKNSVASISRGECEVKSKTGIKDVFPLLIDLPETPILPVLTLNDLLQILRNLSFSKSGNETLEGFRKLTSCVTIAQTNEFLLYDVTVSNITDPKIVVSLEISIGNETNVRRGFYFRISNLTTSNFKPEEDEMFLPPKGIDCGFFDEKSSTKKLSIKLPEIFSVWTEYTNFSHIPTIKNYNHIIADYTRNLISFDYKLGRVDEIVSSRSLFNVSNANYRVVHDFTTGLQYATDKDNLTCSAVTPIPIESGDSEMKENKTLEMKNAFELLLLSGKANFSYVGVRRIYDLPADVYISTTNDTNGNKAVFEIWTVNDTESGISGALPIALLVYRKVNNESILSSRQHFSRFVNHEPAALSSLGYFHVLPCLELVQNYSYLVIQLFSEHGINNIDFHSLKLKLREHLAMMANVSLLRVDDFYFQPVNETLLYTFFVLSNRSAINGTQTTHFIPEISVQKAYENLNDSLNRKEWIIEIGSIKLHSTKNSLNFVPPYFTAGNGTTTIVVNKSSKGAMAALAIFMLVIGLAGGFGLAFFLYKRNRGIQYQIYE